MYHSRVSGSGVDSSGAVASAIGVRGSVYRNVVKRLLDVALVLLLAPIIIPTIAILALLVRLDGGPSFYGQARVGRDGEIFICWKLRTMNVDADGKLQAILGANPAARLEWETTQKLKCDPRTTRLGCVMRRSSLDELPQLWNILIGEMSLVGPRPMMPSQQKMYRGTAYYDLVPGLTGYWQVSDRNESNFAARVGFDDRYARELTFATDIRILFRTVGVVLRGTGY